MTRMQMSNYAGPSSTAHWHSDDLHRCLDAGQRLCCGHDLVVCGQCLHRLLRGRRGSGSRAEWIGSRSPLRLSHHDTGVGGACVLGSHDAHDPNTIARCTLHVVCLVHRPPRICGSVYRKLL